VAYALPQDIDDYAAAHTSPPAGHMAALAEETADTLGSEAMLTGPVEGRLLEALVFAMRPQTVLEIGTFSGYSALSMAAVLPDGAKIITCELEDERADFAERHIAQAGQSGRIEIRRGPALETIAALDGPFDLVFVDADKTGYRDYYEAVLPKLSDNGLMLIDNVLWSGRVLEEAEEGDESTAALRELNDHITADPRTVNTLLTIRDGIMLVRRA
jgi:caffeoyl-CoA O-methyltransferase